MIISKKQHYEKQHIKKGIITDYYQKVLVTSWYILFIPVFTTKIVASVNI